MPLIRYQPVTDKHTTHWLREPYDTDGERLVEDLGELDGGYRYVLVPDDVTLPEQPTVTAEAVTITPRVRQIVAQSKHGRLLAERASKRPAMRYTERDLGAMERLSATTGERGDYVAEARGKGGDMRAVGRER